MAYYFEAMLLTVDARVDNSLRVENDRSDLFYFDKLYDNTVLFQFAVPDDTPYIVWLKVGCIEEKNAYYVRYYGKRVAGC